MGAFNVILAFLQISQFNEVNIKDQGSEDQ